MILVAVSSAAYQTIAKSLTYFHSYESELFEVWLRFLVHFISALLLVDYPKQVHLMVIAKEQWRKVETWDASESLGLELTCCYLYLHFIGKNICISGVGKYILPLVKETAKVYG